MNPFEHFLLTCFNAPVKSGATAGAGSAPAPGDPAWLAGRFDLFERVCLPAVARQTEGAFQWLVFMDWSTPVAFKEKMAALTVRHEFLRPVYCSGFDEDAGLTEIRRHEEPGKVRITTPLDVAAALHSRFVAQVQEVAALRMAAQDLARGFAIVFPVGCVGIRGDFYVRRENPNEFASYVSAPETSRIAPGAVESVPRIAKNAAPLWCRIAPEDAPAPPRGIYWPGGAKSEFAPGLTDGLARPWAGQVAELLRSSARYFFRR